MQDQRWFPGGGFKCAPWVYALAKMITKSNYAELDQIRAKRLALNVDDPVVQSIFQLHTWNQIKCTPVGVKRKTVILSKLCWHISPSKFRLLNAIKSSCNEVYSSQPFPRVSPPRIYQSIYNGFLAAVSNVYLGSTHWQQLYQPLMRLNFVISKLNALHWMLTPMQVTTYLTYTFAIKVAVLKVGW